MFEKEFLLGVHDIAEGLSGDVGYLGEILLGPPKIIELTLYHIPGTYIEKGLKGIVSTHFCLLLIVGADFINPKDPDRFLLVLPVYLYLQSVFPVNTKRKAALCPLHSLKVQGWALLKVMDVRGCINGSHDLKEALNDLLLQGILL